MFRGLPVNSISVRVIMYKIGCLLARDMSLPVAQLFVIAIGNVPATNHGNYLGYNRQSRERRGAPFKSTNLFRAKSAPIVGIYVSYVCTSWLISITLANLLAERPMPGIAFTKEYVKCCLKNGGISGGNVFQKSIFRPL